MKFLCPLLALLSLASSCNTKSKGQKQDKQEAPSFVLQEATWMNKLTEWNVANYNDSAKWRVYCYYGDDTSTKGTNNRLLAPIPLGFLDLKLCFATYSNDTLDLLYKFIYDDSTAVRYRSNRNKDIIIDSYREVFGVSFNIKADTVIGYIAGDALLLEYGPKARYENFTHPDLVRFASQNTSSLHLWFRKEAIRRGLLIK